MKILITTGRPSYSYAEKSSKSSYIITRLYHNNMAKGVCLKRVKDYPMALRKCFASAADGHFIVGGGIDDDRQAHYEVYQYNRGEDEWKSLPNMNAPRFGAKSCYARNTLFVLGGLPQWLNGAKQIVEYLKIDEQQCKYPTGWGICQTPFPMDLHETPWAFYESSMCFHEIP